MTDKINKNGFELHNLKHVSVSQANKFREAPDAWIADKLYGYKSPYGYPALQGLAAGRRSEEVSAGPSANALR